MFICLFINLSGCPGLSCSMWALHCGMWDAGIPNSVQFSHSVMSNSLQPHESLHARPPCPSPTPGVHSDSRPSSQWCHPAISSSVVTFSSCPNPSQHQSLFYCVNSSHEVAKVLTRDKTQDPCMLSLNHWTTRKKEKVKLLSCVQLFATPWTVAH